MTSTNIHIDISIEPAYVYLRCTGPYSLAEAKRIYKSAVDASLESHRSRVLIDALGITGDVQIMERFEGAVFLSQYIKEKALGKISRVVLVGQEPLIDKARFGETVAVNRGVTAKIVSSIDEAIEWLKR